MVIGAEREPELETENGHKSCIMWSTCLDLRDEHREGKTFDGRIVHVGGCGWGVASSP